MNCRRAKKLILEFVDGLPSESLRLELERHLGECTACEQLASSLNRSMELLRRAPIEPVDDNFNWKVRLAVHKERSVIQQQAASQGNLLRAWNVRYGFSAAAGVVAVIAAGWLAVQVMPGLLDNGRRAPQQISAPVAADNGQAETPTIAGNTNRERPAPTEQPSQSQTMRSGNFGPEVVSLGNTPAVSTSRRPGAIDATSSIDSLVESDLEMMTPEERAVYLQELITRLQGHLSRYERRIDR